MKYRIRYREVSLRHEKPLILEGVNETIIGISDLCITRSEEEKMKWLKTFIKIEMNKSIKKGSYNIISVEPIEDKEE